MLFSDQKRSLLSSEARVQAPFIKVTIGNFTFGVFTSTKKNKKAKDNNDFYSEQYNVQYPNYVDSLNITKINGQVNTYSLTFRYPVRPTDDPNFFEKVFSSVSSTRKIVFSYGDASMPSYIYKDEEAIITDVKTSFNFGSGGLDSIITYNVSAVSSSALGLSGCFTFINSGKKKPSKEIKDIFFNKTYGLEKIFTGMNRSNFDYLVDGWDKEVELDTKTNISVLDYITYLVSCMVPEGSTEENVSNTIYILTLHDDTIYDKLYSDTSNLSGPYFRVSKTSYTTDRSDAYEINIGFNTTPIVTSFTVENNENYSIYYDYQKELYPEEYVRRINNNGEWEDIFAPSISSRNDKFKTETDDITWWTKITKYPINASITVQGLLRPAMLMSYVRLNVIFPGGNKHISSGLYIVTKQQDSISGSGYRTTLSLTRVGGSNQLTTGNSTRQLGNSSNKPNNLAKRYIK